MLTATAETRFHEMSRPDRPLAPYEMTQVDSRMGPAMVIAAGATDLPAVLLLHAQSGGSLVWNHQMGALAGSFRILIVDLTGVWAGGAAARPVPSASIDGEWVGDILDGLGIGRVSLVGLSRGCRMAVHLAATQPERVHRMALLSPVGVLPGRRGLLPAIWPVARPEQPAQLPMPRSLLRRVAAPTLVLVGERDRTLQPRATLAQAQRAFPSMVLGAVVPEAGHAVQRDQPAAVNGLLADFLLNGEAWQQADETSLEVLNGPGPTAAQS